MDRIEDLLPPRLVRRLLLLEEERVKPVVAVEDNVEAVGGKLAAGEQHGVIGIVAPIRLKLGQLISAIQQPADKGAGRIVLDVDLDANCLSSDVSWI